MTIDNQNLETATLATLAAAKEKADRLQSAYDSLEARVSKYTADLSEAVEAAQATEQAAADQVAAAIANGEDESVIRQAEEQLTQASEKTQAAIQAATGGAVLAALNAQLESLIAPLDEARKSQASAQFDADALRRASLQDAWEKGIYALIDDIGIELSSLCVEDGFWDMRGMKIPLFKDSRSIDSHAMQARRAGRAAVVHSTTPPPTTLPASTKPTGKPTNDGGDVLDYGNEGDAPAASGSQRTAAPRARAEHASQRSVWGTGRASHRIR